MTAIVQKNSQNSLALQMGISDIQLQTLRDTYAKGATDAQLILYAHDCQRNGVSVLDRLIHFTQRDGKYTPITSIDFLRSRAADTCEVMGIDEAQFEGTPMQKGFRAYVTVYRFVQNQRCAFSASARWEEYYPGDKLGFMWRKMPYVMLGKCAEALALRKAFPKQLAGLYTQDEMAQAGSEIQSSSIVSPVAPPVASKKSEVDEAFPRVDVDMVSAILDKAKALYPRFYEARLSSIIESVKGAPSSLDGCTEKELSVVLQYLREREKGAFKTADEANDWIANQMGRAAKTAPKTRVEEAVYTEIPKDIKSPLERTRQRFHATGTHTFGKQWDLVRKCLTAWVNTKYTSSNDMTLDELGKCIEQMEMAENERDLTLQSRLDIIENVPML